jgi:hypothetical protein
MRFCMLILQFHLDVLDPWEGLANGDDPLYEFSGGSAEIIDPGMPELP